MSCICHFECQAKIQMKTKNIPIFGDFFSVSFFFYLNSNHNSNFQITSSHKTDVAKLFSFFLLKKEPKHQGNGKFSEYIRYRASKSYQNSA